jgi:nitronate monooxygenase
VNPRQVFERGVVVREPLIIQAGMGVAVSDWRLAHNVARLGQLGVVSGTALDAVLVRRLQLGDRGGHIRRAIAKFPIAQVGERIIEKYFRHDKTSTTPFARLPLPSATPTRESVEVMVLANFVEVYLAKENHNGRVGINYLEKVQVPHLPSIYGAMLAGVDYVLMGAGIPREIPAVLDSLSRNEETSYSLYVAEAQPGDSFQLKFSPREFMGNLLTTLKRPKFLAIVASNTLAFMLAKKISPPVDGFVIEAPSAGGHNAPPRGKLQLNERGEPVYGVRDEVDLTAMKALGLPFYLAGSRGSPEDLKAALDAGATGIQVGTAFALAQDSGLSPSIRSQLLKKIANETLDIYTDPRGSPTGFPFKVARLEGTNSDTDLVAARVRVCDLGYLREPYRKADGVLGYRCPSEPVDLYVKKGGAVEDTVGRMCLCNGMMANIDQNQWQASQQLERPVVTLGDNIECVRRLIKKNGVKYTSQAVLEYLLEGLATTTPAKEETTLVRLTP